MTAVEIDCLKLWSQPEGSAGQTYLLTSLSGVVHTADVHHTASLDTTLYNEIPLIRIVSKGQKIKLRLKMGLTFTPEKQWEFGSGC